jgi:hypothetical protein
MSCEQGQHSQTVSAALTGQPEKFAGNTTHMARSWAATDVLTATIAISPVLRPFFTVFIIILAFGVIGCIAFMLFIIANTAQSTLRQPCC